MSKPLPVSRYDKGCTRGGRRDENPCQGCGEARTWQTYLRDCMCRGDASGTVNAILAGFAGAQKGSESATFKGGDAA